MDERIDIGTHSLHIRCIGEGSPAVVVDTGLGDTSEGWHAMQAQIAQHTRACVYDRAGYGSSEPGPLPRHSAQMADELEQLLEVAGVAAPYVLLGHSLGGLNAQVFAGRHPERLAGLVLLDPPPLGFITGEAYPELYHMAEQQTAQWQQAAQALKRSRDPAERAQARFLETLASEHAMFLIEGAQQAVAIESFGDLPLVIVGASRPNPAFGEDAEAFQRFWIEQSRELAARSTRGTFVLAPESGHHLHVDAPDVVLEAVRQVVAQVE
jgi:pimeloyl-ACP methyl ester carboxylesterase